MSFYTNEFLNIERQKWLNNLTLFQYKENGSWKTATINSKEVQGTDLVVLAYAPSNGSSGTITEVRVYDANGVLAGSESISISRLATQNVLLRIKLPIKEV